MYSSIECDIKLPKTLKHIGDYAFAECYISVTEKFTINYALESIGDYAFYKCNFNIPGAHYPGNFAFSEMGCLNSIGAYAFSESEIGTKAANASGHKMYGLKLPASIQEIGIGAFSKNDYYFFDLGNTQIRALNSLVFYDAYIGEFTLPPTLEEIADSACMMMRGRQTTIPAAVIRIGNEAFSNGKGKILFEDMSNLEYIGDNAFANHHFYKQETLALPAGLIEIGDSAFYKTTDLALLSIPSSVTSIGSSLCNRADVTLEVETGSYAAIYASENGYSTRNAGGDDTSWLNN